MRTLDYGKVPADLKIDEPYTMRLSMVDEAVVAAAVNQGIDSCLEVIHTEAGSMRGGKRPVRILDSKSMRCLLRRLVESEDEEAGSLASDIMGTLGYEWV